MKIIDKYLLREYAISVAFCLGGFLMIHFIYDLFFHLPALIKARTPIGLAIRYYTSLLAPTLEYVVPSSLLLATLYTLWQFTRHNELTAMRASGIGLIRLLVPFLAVGIFFSIATSAIKEAYVPHARQFARELAANDFAETKHRLIHDFRYINSASHRQWRIGEIDMNHPDKLYNVLVTQERSDGTREEKIFAWKAEWLDGEWWFYDMEVKKYTIRDSPLSGTTNHLTIGSVQGRCMPQFTERPGDFAASTKRADCLSSMETIRYLKSHPEISKAAAATRKTDLHLRIAMPWACFIIALFGIPAGAKTGRESVLTGIMLAFSLFFGFYALTQIGVFLSKTQIIWPWLGAWMSNIVFLIAGIFMMAKLR